MASVAAAEKTVRILLDNGADVDARAHSPESRSSDTALMMVSAKGYESIAQLLINQGAEVNVQGGKHGNALQAASHKGHLKVVEMLLMNHAEADLKDQYGRVPIAWAAMGGRRRTPRFLLLRKAGSSDESVELVQQAQAIRPDSLGCSLIHFLAMGNCSSAVEELLNGGISIDMTDNHGWTALHWAAYFGNYEVARVLVKMRADQHRCDWQGWTPYHVSALVESKVVMTALSSADINRRTLPNEAEQFNCCCNCCQHVSQKTAHEAGCSSTQTHMLESSSTVQFMKSC